MALSAMASVAAPAAPGGTVPGTAPRDCRPVTPAPGGAPGGTDGVLLRCLAGARRPAPYYLHLPRGSADGAPVIVALHGISRHSREQAEAFGACAARQGMVTVAPRFSRRHFPGYQRLGLHHGSRRSRPDDALLRILDEVAAATGADTRRVLLFGYSGGGQLAHRFALRHPERVRAMVLGAPGWYTFPDPSATYPRGVRLPPGLEDLGPFDLEGFLRVPALVLVGEADHGRDAALNRSRRIDHQQGRTRLERARRWIDAMHAAAAARGLSTPHRMGILPRCGHSFAGCVREGGLVPRTLAFMIAPAGLARGAVAARPASARPFVLFHAAGR